MTKSFQYDPPLQAGYYTSWGDRSLGKLSGGQHTILLVLDATGVIEEFNEFDNTLSRTITVKAAVGPNLTPYKPTSWADKIVLSTTTGTHTDDSPLTSDDTLYLDWAVINNGTEATATKFYVGLYVDDQKVTDWYCNPPLNPTFYTSVSDYALGKLSAGSHTIKLIADTKRVVEDYNESDNEYTRTITVSQATAPNLTPYHTTGWSEAIVVSRKTGTHTDDSPLYENEALYLDWAIINNGDMAITESFSVSLLVDGNQTFSWPINPPLNAGYYTSVSDQVLGTLAAGTHTIRLVIDSSDTILESNESDNEFTKTITILEAAGPNLRLVQPDGWSALLVVSKNTGTHTDDSSLVSSDSLYLDFAVENNGSDAVSGTFYIELYVDDNLTFTWSRSTPLDAGHYLGVTDFALGQLTEGTHTIEVVVDSTNTITEYNESDNEYSRTITITQVAGPD